MKKFAKRFGVAYLIFIVVLFIFNKEYRKLIIDSYKRGYEFGLNMFNPYKINLDIKPIQVPHLFINDENKISFDYKEV